MLNARYFLTVLALVSLGNLIANELRFSDRVLAFGEPGKMLIAH